MATSNQEEEPPDAPGRDEFIDALTNFANERGINVDFNARVNGKHIDLYKLWNIVTSKGGYDTVSAEKLAWRKVGHDFNLGSANAAAYAFALKTTYYKNLAAYEIKHLHNRDPPPIEILEKLTAKGGDILSRNIENFKPPTRSSFINGDSESESDEAKTPKEDKMEIDEPSSVGGRSTRGLRQAPAPRQLFQPDVSASRQTRHSSGQLQSPQPSTSNSHTSFNYSASSNPNSASFTISNYEPRPQMPLTLRPIMTPGNNPAFFKEKQRLAREARKVELGLVSPSTKGMMRPGAGFDGPNIYVRTLQGLRSKVPEEEDYALHHLVKISHERGDKYKFDAFPNLAEGLIEYLLRVSSLFYNVQWKISYTGEISEVNELDGINGTPDILQRIQCLKRIDTEDDLESTEFARQLTKILEAGLTVRNLALLEDNALYLSEMPQLRDFLSIALNLPSLSIITELKHYALEIAEQVTRYWRMDSDDPLYRSLLHEVEDGRDRGAILTSLRAISRISMNLDNPNLLQGVPSLVVRNLCEWILLEDEELVSTCLDFFYLFTAVPDNVIFLLSHSHSLPISSLLAQLSRLLQYGAKTVKQPILDKPAIAVKPATTIPNVPRDLLEHLLAFKEPDRSNHWLRCVFEEDSESHITQIALWQAYQNRFAEFTTPQETLLPAAEFIKNVSTIFTGANAQVVNGPNQKFIIKGIRPRHAPVDVKGRVYQRCLWKEPNSQTCGEFYLKPHDMFEHIVEKHIGLQKKDGGSWDIAANVNADKHLRDCYWANCRHFSRRNASSPSSMELGMHVKTHLPDVSKKSTHRQKHNRTPTTQTYPLMGTKSNTANSLDIDPEQGRPATYRPYSYEDTLQDKLGNAEGLPLTSVLILRNLARNIPRAAALKDSPNEDALRFEWMETTFGPLMEKLMFSMAHNRPLAGWVHEVITLIEKGSTA